MFSEEMQRSLAGRIRALEQDAYRLLIEIGAELGPRHRRRVRVAKDKLDVAFSAMDDLVFTDEADLLQHVDRIHQMSDELISRRAELDRERRLMRRSVDELDHQRLARETKFLADELEAELGRIDAE